MSMKRNQKRKKSSKARQKSRRLAIQRERRMEEFELFASNAEQAYRDGKSDQCLKWATKALKIHPNNFYLRGMAVESAMGKLVTVYGILLHAWEEGVLDRREELFIFAEIAVERKDYHLARRIYQHLLEEEHDLNRPLTKSQRKEAEQYLQYLDVVAPVKKPAPAGGTKPISPQKPVLKTKPIRKPAQFSESESQDQIEPPGGGATAGKAAQVPDTKPIEQSDPAA